LFRQGTEIQVEDVGEAFVAGVVSAVAAAITLILIVVVVAGFVGAVGFKLGLISGEGFAWIGISFGIPLGLLCAVFVFIYSFKKIRAYGRSE
jgi:hypothetical protein